MNSELVGADDALSLETADEQLDASLMAAAAAFGGKTWRVKGYNVNFTLAAEAQDVDHPGLTLRHQIELTRWRSPQPSEPAPSRHI